MTGSPQSPEDRAFLDGFEWTPELLADYAERARVLAVRYGGSDPVGRLSRHLPGPCLDCDDETGQRFQLGRRLFCRRHAADRLRVKRLIEDGEVAA